MVYLRWPRDNFTLHDDRIGINIRSGKERFTNREKNNKLSFGSISRSNSGLGRISHRKNTIINSLQGNSRVNFSNQNISKECVIPSLIEVPVVPTPAQEDRLSSNTDLQTNYTVEVDALGSKEPMAGPSNQMDPVNDQME